MTYAADHRHDPEPASAALVTLGMVGALLMVLTQRVLPLCAGCPAAQAAVVRLHLAMGALAALAWQDLEAGAEDAATDARMDAMTVVAAALRDALTEALAALARHAALPPKARRGRGLPAWLGTDAACRPQPRAAALARDGPPSRS